MSKEINKEQLKIVLSKMEAIEKEHPKANVYYDTEREQIVISYPLPKDYFQFKKPSNQLLKEI